MKKQIANKDSRFESLDALRGIAALIVVLFHCSLMLPESFYTQRPLWVSFMPTRFLFNGYAAVIIFFILSGYVLAIPFIYGKTQQSYISYMIRRICRIYIPFAGAILISALLYANSQSPPPGLAGDELYKWWGTIPLTTELIVKHLLLTGVESEMWLDMAMWSLVVEMRISIIFPILIILCSKPKAAISIALLLYVSAVISMLATGNLSLISSKNFLGTFIITLRYLPFFLIGILLMKYNNTIQTHLGSLSHKQHWVLLIFALLILCLPTEINNRRILAILSIEESGILIKFLIECLYGIASAFIIVSVRRIDGRKTLLHYTPIKWLGSISYSLYLLHMPIILFLFRVLVEHLPIFMISLIAFAASIIVSSVFHIAVEQPAIRYGKYLSKNNHKGI